MERERWVEEGEEGEREVGGGERGGWRSRDENSSRPSAKIRSNTFSGRLFLPVTVT